MKTKLIAGLLTILMLLASSVALAQSGGEDYPTDNDVNFIAKKLYCPVCPNTPLDVCETQACQDWRAQIKEQLKEGWTEDQILGYFVDQYGERVLAEPERKGFTSLIWILPAIAVMLGLVVIWQVLRVWGTNREDLVTVAPEDPSISPELLTRIEDELKGLR